MKYAKVLSMDLPKGRRVFAVSDIHGSPLLFRTLLEQAGFCKNDILFVLGDVLEKGPDSLATLRYLMDLSRRYEIYTVCGNCDDLVMGFVDGREELSKSFFDYYLRHFGRRCTLIQMGLELGLTPEEMADYPRFAAALDQNFGPELDFLRALPTVIETPEYLFVHGGVPSSEGLANLEAWRCMKNDNFLSQATRLDRWCIVGHWPVSLYRPHVPSANPLISPEKRVVSIDGGCAIKRDGQLNLLELPAAPGGEFTWRSADGLPIVTALDAQEPSADSINIRWGRNEVEILERGTEFSLCRHVESGRVLSVLSDDLCERRGKIYCEDTTDFHLGAAPGDRLSLVRRTSRGLLVKRAGVSGWYLGRVEEKEDATV